MASPDVVTYFDLELTTLDEQTLIDTALANASLTFPDWIPREGNTEVVILEQNAGMVANLAYLLNQLPSSTTEVLLRLFGLTRDPGQPPVVDVAITVTDAAGYTIPTGTVVRLDLGDSTDPVDFLTMIDLVIAPGATSGVVTASATEATIRANGVPTGTTLDLLDAISYIEDVTTTSPITGGTGPEDGPAFLTRGAPLLSRLTNTLVRPVDLEAYAVESNPSIVRVRTIDLYNPATPEVPPGQALGYVTVAVAGTGGTSLGVTARATLAAQYASRMHAGLTINVVDADVATIDVDVTVLRYASADDTATAAAVTAEVSAYLNPDTWEWSNLSRVNELIAVADRAAGVDTVIAVAQTLDDSYTTTDLTLPGVAPLAKVGTVTVTVQAP